jgi:hypothetical protein
MLAGTFDHDPVPVGKLFDPCWHFSRSRQRLIAPMPLLAYLAGQRDPDGHMIIVALDLNVGMEIDVCHFPPVGCQNLAIVAGQAFQAARSYSLDGPAPDLFLGEVGDGVVGPGRVQLAGRQDASWEPHRRARR